MLHSGVPQGARMLTDFSLLRLPDFRLLYLGQFVSGFGSALTYVVLPMEMYRLTKSPVLVGLLGVAEFLPMLLVAFAGGLLADRLERRRLLLWADSLLGLCLAGLALNAAQPKPGIWPLFAGAALLAGLQAIHRPAIEALTPQLVPAGRMKELAALNSLRGNAAFIAGPALAGWIALQFGAATAFALDAVTYFVSVFALACMRGAWRGGEEGGLTWAALTQGWRYALKRQDLLGTYLIDINAMFFGMPNALFPAFGEQFGAGSTGLLYSAGPAGALLVSLTSRWTKHVHRHGLAIAWAAALWGLAIVGFGLSPNLPLALLCLAIAGGADMVSSIFRMTIWNQTIPAHLRGRTAAIEMVSYLTGPYLGNAEAGLAAAWLGLRRSVALGGLACVAGCVLITAALPGFRRYREQSGLSADIVH